MRSLGLQSHGRCDGGYIVLAAWRAGAAARVRSVRGVQAGGECIYMYFIEF